MVWQAIVQGLFAFFLAAASLLTGSINGAIFTTTADGSSVNGNIYQERSDVFLNGGPQSDHGALLSPDGVYYFQVTDPSGAVLLSADELKCRVVSVTNGTISGTASDPSCAHKTGVLTSPNGTRPVALMPYDPTPNHGGEYKVWLTPVSAYGVACRADQGSFGFCDSASKTDNFKVRASSPAAAHVTVCKFNDVDADGIKSAGEPFIAHWPISASGVDGGLVTAQTDDRGCAAFSFSGFTDSLTSRAVTITEGSFGPDWRQTAPVSCADVAGCAVDNGVITIELHAGDDVAAPDFGNTNPYCQTGCVPGSLIATATTYPSFVRQYAWEITKTVDRARVSSSSAQATANYVVSVTHDAGTDSDWKTSGTIRVANPGGDAIAGLDMTALTDNGGTCVVNGGDSIAVSAGSHEDVAYRCAFAAAPVPGTLTIAGQADARSVGASATIDFVAAVINELDAAVVVTDSMAGDLGTLTVAASSPAEFRYSRVVTGTAGTCTTTRNTASLLTSTTQTTHAASQAVTLCVGANLRVGNTALASFGSSIDKRSDRVVVQQQSGTATFNYTVTVRESGWLVRGVIQVTNPNDWQAIDAALRNTVSGASCMMDGGDSITVAPLATVIAPYTCAFDAAPSATGSDNAQVTWESAVAFTTESLATTTAAFGFEALTINDAFDGAAAIVLGRITSPAAITSFAYPRTVANASAGRCQAFTNIATIAGREAASHTVYACNTTTGARTIGFWQNKNGQAIITGGAAISGACASSTWLRQFTAFADLAAGASCKTVASYATAVIKNASAAGAAMNAMLKAQMLATAFDVFFSDAALGGNALAAPVSIGSVRMDLASQRAAFDDGVSATALQMLIAQNRVSNAGGTLWYGNNKALQELAKNAFDAINNEIAPIAR